MITSAHTNVHVKAALLLPPATTVMTLRCFRMLHSQAARRFEIISDSECSETERDIATEDDIEEDSVQGGQGCGPSNEGTSSTPTEGMEVGSAYMMSIFSQKFNIVVILCCRPGVGHLNVVSGCNSTCASNLPNSNHSLLFCVMCHASPHGTATARHGRMPCVRHWELIHGMVSAELRHKWNV